MFVLLIYVAHKNDVHHTAFSEWLNGVTYRGDYEGQDESHLHFGSLDMQIFGLKMKATGNHLAPHFF